MLASFLLFLAPSLLAQEPRGHGRISGSVLGADGAPLAGANVTLRPAGDLPGSPQSATTGGDGSWAVALLSPGVWTIRIEATGHLPGEGFVRVPAEGPADPVRVELRSIDEVTPAFAEGDPTGTARRWLEKGQALLDQGRPGEARAELEKVLRTEGALGPVDEPPEAARKRTALLETVARTHFLEGDREAAGRVLEVALLAAPARGPDRERIVDLYRVLQQDAGRGEAAEAFLERLDRDRDALAKALPPELGALLEPVADERAPTPLPERPVVPLDGTATGRFRARISQESPLSDLAVYLERYGTPREYVETEDPGGGEYDLAEETFEVYVPQGYAPAAEGSEPRYGLVVWLSPLADGGLDEPELLAVLDRQRLLWVGANRAGNARFTWDRIGLALDAAHAVARSYDIDPGRVYAAGYSGGGRIASALAVLYPEVFQGALCLYGVSYFQPVPVPDRPGNHWPEAFPEPPRQSLAEVRRDSRFVLLTGELDFNRSQTQAYARAMEEGGFQHVAYLEIPEATHYTFVDAAWLGRALAALDGER